MNAKEAQKQGSHAAILESARDLIRKRGIGGTRVADVMKGAGLTVGGFYAHFSNKEELVDEALRAAGRDLVSRLFDPLNDVVPRERAKHAVDRYLSAAHRDTPACPFPAVIGEIGTSAPEHAAVLGERIEALSSRLVDLVPGDAGSRGRALPLALIALMYGGLSMARALKGSALSNEVLSACRQYAGSLIDAGSAR